ncbi:hypothetical protein Lfu02_80470 [Longispora fulva]|uniref:Uncharacterized protein n=1 Tax=Longispora fulva TaxID=619741 RepID=A0A8J7GL26_9ACTN|nr:hypothetical protein [Longispora fulva]MBG6139455.1 hypothetical protein [Longispora fulva]MBG6141292.1 hypothetical protein [Longispora fulva]MBG6141891.1 hypothetical protein [Longispora fulva]GIG63675.1 hypothetical protein Lfu02_80470 [Longispora fulva]
MLASTIQFSKNNQPHTTTHNTNTEPTITGIVDRYVAEGADCVLA